MNIVDSFIKKSVDSNQFKLPSENAKLVKNIWFQSKWHRQVELSSNKSLKIFSETKLPWAIECKHSNWLRETTFWKLSLWKNLVTWSFFLIISMSSYSTRRTNCFLAVYDLEELWKINSWQYWMLNLLKHFWCSYFLPFIWLIFPFRCRM